MAGPNGNDVFWQDRAARDNSDYNGSGSNAGFYDERGERRQRFSSIKAYILFYCNMSVPYFYNIMCACRRHKVKKGQFGRSAL